MSNIGANSFDPLDAASQAGGNATFRTTPASPAPAAVPPRSPSKTKPPPAAATAYPESVERLITELAHLPGVGRRSAERLAFHVLKAERDDALKLARAIEDVKLRVRHCAVCYNLADAAAANGAPASGRTLCSICAAAGLPGEAEAAIPSKGQRDASLVMVVEQPKDLIALEQTGMYKGVYHVLMGRISPMDGVSPGDLTITDLLRRIEDPGRNCGVNDQGQPGRPVREVILALNPTLEGDGTALYLAEQLEQRGITVTRLARGLPTGSQLEFASKAVLADAIEGRRPM